VELRKSYRFSSTSGIGRFATAVNRGNAQGALELLLDAHQQSELSLVQSEGEQLLRALEKQTVQKHRELSQASEPRQALAQLNEFRVLCAHREGPLGVGSVNQRLEHALTRAGLIKPNNEWYVGRPILITSNDHHLKLFNGDVGLILRDANGALRAFFDTGGGEVRSLSAARLPPHETVFAMSIHKSQGSEFTEVAVVLPRASSPLLTRELLYTAVTRARKRAVLYGSTESIEAAVGKPIARASGLDSLLHDS
jgi:exodeoxyribonuclease V alpha subunit